MSLFMRKFSFLLFACLILYELTTYKLNEYNQFSSGSLSFDQIDKCQNKKPTNKTYVAISVNLDASLDFYPFYLPIICTCWRQLLGFEPIVLGVYNRNAVFSRQANKTIEYLKLLGVKIIYVESVPGYDKMTGMLSRLFIGGIDEAVVNENDFIYTTDSDLIPFRKDYFKIDDFESIILLDAFRFGKFRYKKSFYRMFSMQYAGMTKCRWRETMQLNQNGLKLDGKSVLKLVENIYGKSNVKKNDQILRGDSTWWLDQKMVSIHIESYLKAKSKQTVIYRHYDGLKLDRIYSDEKWLDTFRNKYDSIIDAHLFHDNFIKKIKFIDMIIEKQLNESDKKLMRKYIDEFKGIRNKNKT